VADLNIGPNGLYARVTEDGIQYPFPLSSLLRAERDIPVGETGSVTQVDGKWGMVAVEEVEQPETGDAQIAIEVDPEEYEPGSWRQVWSIVPLLIIQPGGRYARVTEQGVQYPYSLDGLRHDIDGLTFRAGAPVPQIDGEWGVVAVEEVAPPEVSAGQETVEGAPVEYEPGRYRQSWAIRDRSEDELIEAKIAARETVNALKYASEEGTAVTPFGTVDCDNKSRDKLNGAVMMALLAQMNGQAFDLTWTLADNIDVALDAAQTIAMGMAVGQFINANHQHARQLKDAIDGAEDFAQLRAIDVEAGWPQ